MIFKVRSCMGCAVMLAALWSDGGLRGTPRECLDDFEDGSITDGSPCSWDLSTWCIPGTRRVEDGRMILSDSPDDFVGAWLDATYTGGVSVRFQAQTTGNGQIAAVLHGDGVTCGNCYWAFVNVPGGEIGIGRTVQPGAATLAAGSLGWIPSPGDDLIFQLDSMDDLQRGSILQLRIWRPGEEIPDEPLLEATDSLRTYRSGVAGTYYIPRELKAQARYDYFHVFEQPAAAMTIDPESGPAPLEVTVDGTPSATGASRTIESYQWDFGDGPEPEQGERATHTYTEAGQYTVRLTVTDDLGLSGSAIRVVLVGDPPACKTCVECLDDFEDGSITDGSPCSWDLSTWCIPGTRKVEDGRMILSDSPDDFVGTWQNATYTGEVSLRFQAQTTGNGQIAAVLHGDGVTCGNCYWAFVNIPGGEIGIGRTVQPGAATLAAGSLGWVPSPGDDLIFQFDSTDDLQRGSILQLRIWRPGEEIPDEPLLEATDSLRTYQSGVAGTYYIPREPGAEARYEYFHVFERPAAAMTIDPESGPAPLEVTVDGQSSAACCGHGIETYSWDFGDGTDPEQGDQATHTYAEAGEYTVRLTVTDDRGASSAATGMIQVSAPPRPRFRRGDANDDGAADISDAVSILDWLFLGGEAPGCLASADTNGDGGADLSDAVYLLGHLFLGGPRPKPPFPDCGPLPLDEILQCAPAPQSCAQR